MNLQLEVVTVTALLFLSVVFNVVTHVQAASEDEGLVPVEILSKELGALNNLFFKTVSSGDRTVVGMTTAAVSANRGILWESTKSFGTTSSGQQQQELNKMTLESCLRMGRMTEVLISFAALKMQSDHTFATGLDDGINAAFSPRGVALTNPHNSLPITYKQLMTHTSTILDTSFDGSVLTTPNTVGTLEAFVENYFVSPGGTLVSSAFAVAEPGTTKAYAASRANTALLAYILEKVIVVRELQYNNLRDYLATEILGPIGMSSTFFLNADGTTPGVSASPSFSGTFSAASINFNSLDLYSDFYSGCIADDSSSGRSIHPAWAADYMGYTTTNDILKLVYGLFIIPKYSSIAIQMKELMKVEGSAASISGQSGRGIGLMFFDGTPLCRNLLSTRITNTCPLSNLTTLVGYAATRGNSGIAFMCGETDNSASGQICTVSSIVHSTVSQRSVGNLLTMMTGTFQDIDGETRVETPAPQTPLRTDTEERLYGFYVWLSVYLSIMTILLGTSLIQWAFLPAALAANTDTNGASHIVVEKGSPRVARRGPSVGQGGPLAIRD